MGGYSQSGPGAGATPQTSGGDNSSPGATQNPALRSALGQLTGMAQNAQQYAKAYPQCADEMRQIGELLQKCLMKTTQAQQQQEPAVPPV